MKKSVLLLVLFLMTQDTKVTTGTKGYQDVYHLHIQWQDVLSQPESRYEVLVYSLNCPHCLRLEEAIVARALTAPTIPLFFMAVTRDLPFGAVHDLNECVCEISQIKIPGYPLLMVVLSGCIQARVLGYRAIVDHCEKSD